MLKISILVIERVFTVFTVVVFFGEGLYVRVTLVLVVHIHTTIITTMREKNWLQLIKSSWWYVVVVVVVHVMCTSGAFAYE